MEDLEASIREEEMISNERLSALQTEVLGMGTNLVMLSREDTLSIVGELISYRNLTNVVKKVQESTHAVQPTPPHVACISCGVLHVTIDCPLCKLRRTFFASKRGVKK